MWQEKNLGGGAGSTMNNFFSYHLNLSVEAVSKIFCKGSHLYYIISYYYIFPKSIDLLPIITYKRQDNNQQKPYLGLHNTHAKSPLNTLKHNYNWWQFFHCHMATPLEVKLILGKIKWLSRVDNHRKTRFQCKMRTIVFVFFSIFIALYLQIIFQPNQA